MTSEYREKDAQVWFSNTTEGLPNEKVGRLCQQVFASYSGPDKGLAIVPDYKVVNSLENTSHKNVVNEIPCACCEKLSCVCPIIRPQSTTSTTSQPVNIPSPALPGGATNASTAIAVPSSMPHRARHPISPPSRDGSRATTGGDFVQYNDYLSRANKRKSLPAYGIVSSPGGGGDSSGASRGRAPIASYDSLYSEDDNFYSADFFAAAPQSQSCFATYDSSPRVADKYGSLPRHRHHHRHHRRYEIREQYDDDRRDPEHAGTITIRRAYNRSRRHRDTKPVQADVHLTELCRSEVPSATTTATTTTTTGGQIRRANSDGHTNVIQIYRSERKPSKPSKSGVTHRQSMQLVADKLRELQLKHMKLELKTEYNSSDNILFVSPAGRKVHTLKCAASARITPDPTRTPATAPPSSVDTPIVSSRVNGVRILQATGRSEMCIDPCQGGISSIDGDDIDNETYSDNDDSDNDNKTAGVQAWNLYNRKAFGISMSLYDQNPITKKISGDPIADAFVICARKNNALMVVADGVNWGEKSKMAARCAIYGVTEFINRQLFRTSTGGATGAVVDTHKITRLLLQSLDAAQRTILRYGGGLTTLCASLIVPMAVCSTREDFYGRRRARVNYVCSDIILLMYGHTPYRFVAITVNVGDSLAFVLSKRYGIREITTGSHDITSCRDVRDAGGALGPCRGNDPELNNLTCSLTFVDAGDIIFLTSDGISDNFDPVVTKLFSPDDITENGTDKPKLTPEERHKYALKTMEQVIHEFELTTEGDYSAQELCREILQHVLVLTNQKRAVLENPKLYKKMKTKEREQRDAKIKSDLRASPGKLDHATIIGYEIGVYHGNQDENYQLFGV